MSEDHRTEKRCPKCKEIKLIGEFGKIKGVPRSHCRPCHAALNNRPDTRTEKKCAYCKKTKAVAEFNRCGKRYQPYCRPCSAEAGKKQKELYKASGRAAVWWRGYYEETKRWKRMETRHGLTREEYETKDEEQNSLCAICRQPETDVYKGTVLRLAVDHDHETGAIRGLLCRSCNLAIGKFKDDPSIVEAALMYLRHHKQKMR